MGQIHPAPILGSQNGQRLTLNGVGSGPLTLVVCQFPTNPKIHGWPVRPISAVPATGLYFRPPGAEARAWKCDHGRRRLTLANRISREDMLRWAKGGALSRLHDIREEEATILRFLGRTPKAHHNAQTKPRRRTMTPAQRKAVSERMKKFWSERRRTKRR